MRVSPTIAFLLRLGLMIGGHAAAADYDDAISAFTRADYQSAIELLEPLAEQGDPRALSLLGVLYDAGHGVGKDHLRAVKLYRLAAEKRYPEAQFYLANAINSRGESAEWYLKAAQQQYAPAMIKLAELYEGFGPGLPHDETQAAFWWRQAAEKNDPDAFWRLGIMYMEGIGVPKDLVAALMWLDIAQGGPGPSHIIFERPSNPATTRRALAAAMAPEQVAEADKRASDWLAAHPL